MIVDTTNQGSGSEYMDDQNIKGDQHKQKPSSGGSFADNHNREKKSGKKGGRSYRKYSK